MYPKAQHWIFYQCWAFLIYLRYKFLQNICISAHFDYDKAVENSLAEIIERDAIMKSWYEHIVPAWEPTNPHACQ